MQIIVYVKRNSPCINLNGLRKKVLLYGLLWLGIKSFSTKLAVPGNRLQVFKGSHLVGPKDAGPTRYLRYLKMQYVMRNVLI